jgi:hypothetical protein
MIASPIGDLCVLKSSHTDTWTVAICWGGIRECLRTFDDFGQAHEFAVDERNRRAAEGADLTIHCPDDCPCYSAQMYGQSQERFQ